VTGARVRPDARGSLGKGLLPLFAALETFPEIKTFTLNRISVLTSYRQPDVIDTASITSWLYTIKSEDNPNKNLVLNARSDLENKNSYKAKMLCVTPHATFQVRGVTNNFSSLSSHILIDLDGSDIPNVINYKSSLADVEYVRAVWTSASGNGLALLIEADTITPQNFKATMNSVHEYFKQMGLRPDPKMKSIASKNVISYDPEIILNKTWKKFKAVENVCTDCDKETYIAKKETIIQEHSLEEAIRLAGENAAKKITCSYSRRKRISLMVPIFMCMKKEGIGTGFSTHRLFPTEAVIT
jgi:hypothetical protein